MHDLSEVIFGLPKVKNFKDDINIDVQDFLCDSLIDKNLIKYNNILKGWKKDIFETLELIDNTTFSTSGYIKLIPLLSQKYPNNKNIDAKIRQVLQQLRDLGLIKFEGMGVYKKLWK